MMKPIIARKQSHPAICERMIEDGSLAGRICGAQMRLEFKEPKVWSYQERVIERCWAGHPAHAQAVVPEPELIDPREYGASEDPPIDDGPADCWGAF